MALRIPRSKSILLSLFICFMIGAKSASAFDVFYLSVGNSRYKDAQLNIPDANLSARQVSVALRHSGAMDGITLISEDNAYLTPDDVLSALREVIGRAKQSDQPIIVLYFLGHGLSEGGTLFHVSVTGSEDGSGAEASLLRTQTLRDTLSDARIPYVLIMDNCFWRQSFDIFGVIPGAGALAVPGDALVGLNSVVGEKLFGLGAQLNQLSSDKAVPQVEIYAASEGSAVPTMAHPENPRYAIGPLARRLLLIFSAKSTMGNGLTLAEFIRRMEDPIFDPGSEAGHIIELSTGDGAEVVFRGDAPEPVDTVGEIRSGSDG